MKLSYKGRINKRFANLKDRLPVYMSYVYGMSPRHPWQSKGTPGTMRKESKTKPGQFIIIDQLVSAKLGLIPQIHGYMKI